MKLRSLAVAAAVGVLAAVPADAGAIKVNVRVEGEHRTIFERNVDTFVHDVAAADGDAHRCDGTNGGASDTAGPTLTGAFDDAARKEGVRWEGSWSQSFEDFLINRVGPDSATDTQFWGTALNFEDTSAGGCQVKVEEGDEVLIAFDSFGKPKLRLTGPRGARAGEVITLLVRDGASGQPVKGALVGNKASSSAGRIYFRMRNRALYRFKAGAPDTVRSNEWKVRVK